MRESVFNSRLGGRQARATLEMCNVRIITDLRMGETAIPPIPLEFTKRKPDPVAVLVRTPTLCVTPHSLFSEAAAPSAGDFW